MSAAIDNLRPFLHHLTDQRGRLANAYFYTGLGVLLQLGAPWPLKFLIDDVLVGSLPQGVLQAMAPSVVVLVVCCAMIVLLVSIATVLAAEKVAHARIRQTFGLSLREQLLRQIHRMSLYSRQAEHSGELTMRLMSDSQLVSRLVCKTLPRAAKDFAVAVFVIVTTFFIDYRIGFLCLIMATGLALITLKFGSEISAAAKFKRTQEGEVAAFTQESIVGLEHIQAMSLEKQNRIQYLEKTGASLQAGIREVQIGVKMERAAQIFSALAIGLAAGAGGLLVLNSQMSLGTLIVCIAYITSLMKPIEKLNEIATTVSRGLARAQRLNRLMNFQNIDAVAQPDLSAPELKEIVACDIDFSYPDCGMQTISAFSHRFALGECTVLIGASGSGKSTILRLLLQLLRPDAGCMKINQLPYKDIDAGSLRSQFAVLMQDSHLFSGSMRSVLCELNPNLSDAQIYAALGQVHLIDLINTLPGGLDTKLDEAGARLSGGQRTRLLLARAILSQRPAILLDEPFANIDNSSKEIILHTLTSIKTNHLLVIITHDTTILPLADHILDLNVEQRHKFLNIKDCAL